MERLQDALRDARIRRAGGDSSASTVNLTLSVFKCPLAWLLLSDCSNAWLAIDLPGCKTTRWQPENCDEMPPPPEMQGRDDGAGAELTRGSTFPTRSRRTSGPAASSSSSCCRCPRLPSLLPLSPALSINPCSCAVTGMSGIDLLAWRLVRSPRVCASLQGDFPFARPSDHTAINAAARMQMQFHRILRADFHIKKLYVRLIMCSALVPPPPPVSTSFLPSAAARRRGPLRLVSSSTLLPGAAV